MKKVSDIFLNTIRSILPPFISLLVSAYIINEANSSEWGLIVERILIIGILIQLANWGHREYLLRAFSFKPSELSFLFMSTVLSRLILLLPAGIALLFIFDSASDLFWILGWLIAYFLYQSFDVLVVYQKAFKTQILTELLGFIILMGGLFFLGNKDSLVEDFTKFYALSLILKTLVLSISFRKLLSFNQKIAFQPAFYKEALPFLLIGFTGMLVTKADIYVIGLLASENELGQYQIVITFFIYLQALGSFIATPFLKQMYRISVDNFNSISIKFSLSGVLLTSLAIPLIYLIIKNVYHFSFPLSLYMAGFLAVVPVYLYLPSIVRKYRDGREKEVIFINIAAALISMLSTYYLYQLFGLSGAVAGVAITQWILFVIYRFLPLQLIKTNVPD